MSNAKMLSKDFFLIVPSRKRYSHGPYELLNPRVASPRRGGTPATKQGEVAIKVKLSLPEALFKEPQFSAEIAVPGDAVTGPSVAADVINNIEQVVRETTGIELTISSADDVEPE